MLTMIHNFISTVARIIAVIHYISMSFNLFTFSLFCCSYRQQRVKQSDTILEGTEPKLEMAGRSPDTSLSSLSRSSDVSRESSQSLSFLSSSYGSSYQSMGSTTSCDFSSSREQSTDRYNPPASHPKKFNFSPNFRRFGHRRQMSMDQFSTTTSSATSQSNSTFEEVESIDFSGNHEVELDPYFETQDSRYPEIKGLRDRSLKMNYKDDGHKSGEDSWIHKVRDSLTGQQLPRKSLSRSLSDHFDSSGRRSLLEQLLDYKNQASDSPGSVTTASSTGGTPSTDSGPQFPFESEYQYHVRKRNRSQSSSSLTSGTRSSILSRNPSIDSSSSSYSSPSDSLGLPMAGINLSPAEDVLLNLGFGNVDSFLPERFLRDWYDKLITARRERIQQLQQMELESMWDSMEMQSGFPSTVPSGASTPLRRRSSTTPYNSSDLLHKLDVNSRKMANTRRSRFRRAATVSTYHQGEPEKNKSKPEQYVETNKQDSIDELKYVLERQANIFQSGMDSNSNKDRRRRIFASSRQNSLPLFLETLNEEEEGRYRPFERKCGKMKTFLEEEERLSRSSSKDSDRSKHSEPGNEDNLIAINFRTSNKIKRSDSETSSSMGVNSIASDCSDDIVPEVPSSRESIVDVPIVEESTTEDEKDSMSSLHSNYVRSHGSLFKIPAIIVSGQRALTPQSSSSLEVADIMERREKTSKLSCMQVEPAMISVVLHDVSDHHNGSRDKHLNVLDDGLLQPPSPNCTSVTSPSPISPVTVIELEDLDNVNDNLDSADSQSEGADARSEDPTLILLQPISEEENVSSNEQSREASFEDSLNDRSCDPRLHNRLTINTKDANVEANDGCLSPIMLFNNNRLLVDSPNDGQSQCESAYGSFVDDKGPDIYEDNGSHDVGVQNDDGTLSPLLFLSCSYRESFDDGVYFVVDDETQVDPDFIDQIGSCRETQTDNRLSDASTQTDPALSYTTQISNRSNLSSSRGTFDEFEPIFMHSVTCQTEHCGDSCDASLASLPPHLSRQRRAFSREYDSSQSLCSSCRVQLDDLDFEERLHSKFYQTFSRSISCTDEEFEQEIVGRSKRKSSIHETMERLSKKMRHIQQRTKVDFDVGDSVTSCMPFSKVLLSDTKKANITSGYFDDSSSDTDIHIPPNSTPGDEHTVNEQSLKKLLNSSLQHLESDSSLSVDDDKIGGNDVTGHCHEPCADNLNSELECRQQNQTQNDMNSLHLISLNSGSEKEFSSSMSSDPELELAFARKKHISDCLTNEKILQRTFRWNSDQDDKFLSPQSVRYLRKFHSVDDSPRSSYTTQDGRISAFLPYQRQESGESKSSRESARTGTTNLSPGIEVIIPQVHNMMFHNIEVNDLLLKQKNDYVKDECDKERQDEMQSGGYKNLLKAVQAKPSYFISYHSVNNSEDELNSNIVPEVHSHIVDTNSQTPINDCMEHCYVADDSIRKNIKVQTSSAPTTLSDNHNEINYINQVGFTSDLEPSLTEIAEYRNNVYRDAQEALSLPLNSVGCEPDEVITRQCNLLQTLNVTLQNVINEHEKQFEVTDKELAEVELILKKAKQISDIGLQKGYMGFDLVRTT